MKYYLEKIWPAMVEYGLIEEKKNYRSTIKSVSPPRKKDLKLIERHEYQWWRAQSGEVFIELWMAMDRNGFIKWDTAKDNEETLRDLKRGN